MPFLSKLRKGKKDEEDLEETEESLDPGEEEGFLMSTGGQRGASGEVETTATDQENAAQQQAAPDDLLEAAEGGAAPGDVRPYREGQPQIDDMVEAAGGEQPAPAAKSVELQSISVESSDGADDPLMAAFRDSTVASDVGDLTQDIEDISVEELVAELREVRSMLPPTLPGAGDDETG